jgi:hypothetical protein
MLVSDFFGSLLYRCPVILLVQVECLLLKMLRNRCVSDVGVFRILGILGIVAIDFTS